MTGEQGADERVMTGNLGRSGTECYYSRPSMQILSSFAFFWEGIVGSPRLSSDYIAAGWL